MNESLLSLLLKEDPVAPSHQSVDAWWQWHRGWSPQWPRPIERAIAGGFLADRLAWAFATAYQSALRTLVPALPPETVVALCVTEEQGTSPSAMRSALTEDGGGGLRLEGAKRWTTLGPDGGLFLVAAKMIPQLGDRPMIRLVQVPARTAGVHLQAMPPTSFVPEVAHAQLRFEQVSLPAAAVLPGDGYARYVKPFRTIEDLHVHAAVLACLLRESRRLRWPPDWTERALTNLVAMSALAELDPAAPATHVALAGALSTGSQLAAEADGHWAASADDPGATRWTRDRPLLSIAAQARAARIRIAWERLAAERC